VPKTPYWSCQAIAIIDCFWRPIQFQFISSNTGGLQNAWISPDVIGVGFVTNTTARDMLELQPTKEVNSEMMKLSSRNREAMIKPFAVG
jgi:hypothetical protein